MKKEEQTNDNGFGIASVVLAIISILLSFTGIPSGIMALLALIFALIQRKKANNDWAKYGLILSVISLAISIAVIILYGMLFSAIAKTLELLKQCTSDPTLPGCDQFLPTLPQSGIPA